MARDKWAIVRLIVIVYLILGGIHTVVWLLGFTSPSSGNPVDEFFFYFFLPVWALLSTFLTPFTI